MSFPQFLDYLELEKKYSEHTVLAYQKDLESFSLYIKDEFEQTEIDSVNYSQIRSWIVRLVENGLSNRSVNRKITALKTYYKFLLKTQQLETSPLTGHKALKTPKKIQVPFSGKEVENVLGLFDDSTFTGCRDKLIVELLYTTGIRRAELIDIRLNDIDLSAKTLKIFGKRKKERIVPILGLIVQSIKQYLPLRNNFENEHSKNSLLITQKGVKLYEKLVYRIVNDYFGRVSGKVKKSPHILRHTFATHLLNEGAELNAIKELLGHASLASTQVYTHNSLAELAKVHEKSHPRNRKKQS